MNLATISIPIEIVDSACNSYQWNGNTYTVGGMYSFTFLNNCGCDSILILDLSISYSDSVYIIDTAYGLYNWNGQIINNSGIYNNLLSNVSGCDSVIILELTVVNSTEISELGKLDHKGYSIIDVLGQQVPFRMNTPLFYIYDDGKVDKRIVIE